MEENMHMKSLAALVLSAMLFVTDLAYAKPLIEDHWVDAGKTIYITLIFDDGVKRLLIVEGDGPRVEYCLIAPDGKTVQCGRGYLQIEIPIAEGDGVFKLRIVNIGLIPGNFRIIAV